MFFLVLGAEGTVRNEFFTAGLDGDGDSGTDEVNETGRDLVGSVGTIKVLELQGSLTAGDNEDGRSVQTRDDLGFSALEVRE